MAVITKICEKNYTINGDESYLNHITNEFEPNTTNILTALVEPRHTVIDIGANIGCTLIALGTLCSRAIGFEPNKEAFDYLKENAENSNLKNIEFYNLGISDKKRDATIQHHGNLSGAFVSEDVPGFDGISAEIKMVNLDEFCLAKNIKDINFIKIDVEGYELIALAGCKEILKRDKPMCLLEMNHWCLNAFQRTSLPDFIDRLKEIFPFLYAISDGRSANLKNEAHIYKVLYENIISFKWVDVVGCFDEKQAAKFLSVFSSFDEVDRLPADGKLSFNNFGNNNNNYLTSGWSAPEAWGVWSQGHISEMRFKLESNSKKDFYLTINGRPFLYGSHQNLDMNIVVNGKQIENIQYRLSEDTIKTFKISNNLVLANDGVVNIELQFANPKSPLELNMSQDARHLGLGLISMELTSL